MSAHLSIDGMDELKEKLLRNNVNIAITYAESLIGTKYSFWYPKIIVGDNEPMWVANTSAPKLTKVKSKSVNCVGLVNLMRRAVGLPVPGCNNKKVPNDTQVPGGIHEWYKFLKKQDLLKPFDYNTQFPVGTLFLRKYVNTFDQGHVSVLYEESERGSLYSTIIHSSTNHPFAQELMFDPGVNIDNRLGQSHFFYKDGYYQYYCLPEDWLI